tara:strand:- start:28 stop:342 length:315 start_codon:yes stop_codon:yes gene_type:complete
MHTCSYNELSNSSIEEWHKEHLRHCIFNYDNWDEYDKNVNSIFHSFEINKNKLELIDYINIMESDLISFTKFITEKSMLPYPTLREELTDILKKVIANIYAFSQ